MNIILLVGISGAGKSRWATEYLQAHPDYICINRDSLRLALVRQLKGYYRRPDLHRLEQIVNNITDCLLEQAEFKGYNVLVDNTNLDFKYLIQFINYPKVKSFQFKLFNVRPELAKTRVALRDGLEPEDLAYIDKQAKQYTRIKDYIEQTYNDKLI